MNILNTAINNIFEPSIVTKKTGVLLSINGLNATLLEPNGNKLAVILLNSSFSLGDTVVCNNQIVQRVIQKQKPIPVVRV